ncbi:MAG: type II/IV secretion system protein [Epsilonproteobacteria bacterium]|nr:type II/IV secretion system protein [Campylobacterota bacterium]
MDFNEIESFYSIKEERLEKLAQNLGIDYVISPGYLKIHIPLPLEFLRQIEAVPFETDESVLKIAINRTLNDDEVVRLKKIFLGYDIKFYAAQREDIARLLNFYEYREKFSDLVEDIHKELRGIIEKGKISAVEELMDFMLSHSITAKASDIHIEANEDGCEVRIRIFGVLYDMADFDKEVYNALATRIKLEANMDVSERRKPQDGAFSKEINRQRYDFRVSTLPTLWGESIVIRILDKKDVLKKIDDIGIGEKNLFLLKKALGKMQGIFLVTGPTGSGKTTTLYASLTYIAHRDKKVITLEDPVEYKLRGIQQVQLNPKAGMDFTSALRALLRQDPDIVMIGEIRDIQTLNIALRAALTGHTVLSTIHTNSALDTINRLLDMGAESYLVGDGLIGVMSQRLVRKNCPYCVRQEKVDEYILEPIKNFLPSSPVFYKSKGCQKCNMSGFSGRCAISEIFLNDEVMSSMISKRYSNEEILKYLKSKGFSTILEEGINKALTGEVAIEEVYRVVGV